MTTEIIEVKDYEPEAMLNHFACINCGNEIGKARPAAMVWDNRTESTHFMCANCLTEQQEAAHAD